MVRRRGIPRLLLTALVLGGPLAVPGADPLQAQVTSLDEGSFTITRGGQRVGREDFSIRSSPGSGGQMLVAHGILVMGARRVEPSLNADTSGALFKYQAEIKENGRIVLTYSGEAARDHFSARIIRPDGESARQFRFPAHTVAAEDDVMHQLWFIARRGAGAIVNVLAPIRGVIETVRVALVGNERVSIDSRDIDARHLRLTTEGSGVTRDVWVDAGNHVLKVVIPASRIVAVRDEVPR